jgi:prepilin-type N-terminal cleavage/methylation domain-containing protein
MRTGEAGFTLLETLVAFAILASVLVALYAAGGTALTAIGRDAQAERATLFAQSKLDEMAATREPLPETATGGFPGSDVTWRIDARDLPDGAPGGSSYRLQDVRLTLAWPRGTGHASLRVETRHLGSVKP